MDPEFPKREDATELLSLIAAGDQSAAEALFPLVYEELRARAGAQFRGQPANHTLQPTALVHEAYVKLVRSSGGAWNDRAHFLAVASTAMRQILVDHARRRGAAGRAKDAYSERPTIVQGDAGGSPIDLLALEDAMVKLGKLDPDRAKIIELRFFGGLSNDDVASVLGVTATTIRRQWRQARAWLTRELADARRESESADRDGLDRDESPPSA